ncbi:MULTISPECIES: hypothetical protein [Bacillus]|uniref:SGNH/GDSL hydrolase family protein n=2 Tax=Bacillus TaxID=1386 RepID=A0A0M4FGC3_9BACI|nr:MULTISPECIES: hypothetical protein [Bacillus]ALC81537.1 hypothetical protein AM592_07950 [Bacillus gobiensis]MBP1080590.1 hypothetical protein [Bacillus capparidis]MED1094446.1 hypothetical protein [Bacillus capparidis]
MEKAMAALSVILCITIIIIGNLYWTHKSKSDDSKVSAAAGDAANNNEENSSKKEIENMTYTKNLPEVVANKIEKAIEEKKPLKFVIYGSSAVEEKDGSWSKVFKEALLDTYGEDVFDIHIIAEDGDRDSLDVSSDKSYLKVAELKPDLVLFEPFVLKNNGNVSTKSAEDVAQMVITSIEKANKDAIVMLQPSYPIYDTTYYPQHMESMRKSIESNGHYYLDHWENWPEIEDPKLKQYVEKGNNEPSSLGHEAWSSYLINEFISK